MARMSMLSFMGFGVKLATAITGSVTVLLLAKVGYVPNADRTETAKMGINAIVNLSLRRLCCFQLFHYSSINSMVRWMT